MVLNTIVDLLAKAPLTPQKRKALELAPNDPYCPEIEKLRTSTNKKRLTLNCDEDDTEEAWDVVVACRLIPSAIRDNESVTELIMEYMECDKSIVLQNDVFAALAHRPHNLDLLKMRHCSNDLSESTGFQAYLESLTLGESTPQARTLGKLHLMSGSISAPLCRLLFAQPHRGKIKHVVIDQGSFPAQASQKFASYVRKGTNSNNIGHGNDVVDVSVENCNGSWGHYELATHSIGAFFVPSKGHVRVRSLDMTIGAFRHLPILTYYLPSSLYINELDLTLISNEDERYVRNEAFDTPYAMFHNDPDSRRRQLADAIRRNGSLRSVKVIVTPTFAPLYPPPAPRATDPEPANFLAAYSRVVDACMTRNTKLPELLSTPRFKTDNEDDDDDQRGGTTDLELFGTLFVASIGAPSMAPTNVMIGFFSAEKGGMFTYGPSSPPLASD